MIESAPHNYGRHKVYQGVPGNLVAFACKLSFDTGNDGFVSFESKTKLVSHYQKTLKAQIISGNKMFIDTAGAIFLINQYFNKNK